MEKDDGSVNAGEGLSKELMKYAVDCCCEPLWKDFMTRARQWPLWSECCEHEAGYRDVTERAIENIVEHYRRHKDGLLPELSWSEFCSELETLQKSLAQASISLKRIRWAAARIELHLHRIRTYEKEVEKIRCYYKLGRIMGLMSRNLSHVRDYSNKKKVRGGRGSVYDRIGPRSTAVLNLVDECWDLFCDQGMQYPTTTEGGPFDALCCAVYDLSEGRARASESAGLNRYIKEVRRREFVMYPNAEKRMAEERDRAEHLKDARERLWRYMEKTAKGELDYLRAAPREARAAGTQPNDKS